MVQQIYPFRCTDDSTLQSQADLTNTLQYTLARKCYHINCHKKYQIGPKTNYLHNPCGNLHEHRAVFPETARCSCLLGRPEQPSGRAYVLPVMYLFLFRHSFSELPRPIALKLCHMVGIWLNFIIPLQKFGGAPPPKKIGGQKHAKCR